MPANIHAGPGPDQRDIGVKIGFLNRIGYSTSIRFNLEKGMVNQGRVGSSACRTAR
jgi:hypothetical protein